MIQFEWWESYKKTDQIVYKNVFKICKNRRHAWSKFISNRLKIVLILDQNRTYNWPKMDLNWTQIGPKTNPKRTWKSMKNISRLIYLWSSKFNQFRWWENDNFTITLKNGRTQSKHQFWNFCTSWEKHQTPIFLSYFYFQFHKRLQWF